MEQGEACEYCLVTDDNRWVISFRLNGEFMPLAQQSIARRIVASMNACAGIPDEMLADDCFNKMRDDRDHLIELCAAQQAALGGVAAAMDSLEATIATDRSAT